MRRLTSAALLVAAVACASPPDPGPGRVPGKPPAAAAGDSLRIRVLAIHDFHGVLRPTTYPWSNGRAVGGIGALAALMDSAEAACACPTLRLDGGDEMQGTLESNLVQGVSVVEAFNLLGIDAAAVGNHELDWGIDTFRRRRGEATYPWLAANVFRRDDGVRPDWAPPYALVERDGVRVAIVGYATASTPTTTSIGPIGTAHLDFRPGPVSIAEVLVRVATLDPDFTIIVAHAGGDCRDGRCEGEMVDVVDGLPRGAVDLVVGGHHHSSGEGVIRGVPIVRAGAHGRAVAIVDLVRRPDGSRTFSIDYDTTWARPTTTPDPIEAALAPYLARADSLGDRPVAVLAEPVDAARLGDFIADATRRDAEADVGMYNPGGVRALLDAGTATYADLYRVMPFGNTVVSLELSGSRLREVVELGLRGAPFHFSNLRVEYAENAAPGERVRDLSFVDGRSVEPDGRYVLATMNFLADGGDGFAMLTPLPRVGFGRPVLDVVIERLRELPRPVRLPAREWLVRR